MPIQLKSALYRIYKVESYDFASFNFPYFELFVATGFLLKAITMVLYFIALKIIHIIAFLGLLKVFINITLQFRHLAHKFLRTLLINVV